MKEDFLHFLWQFKKFDLAKLHTTQGEKLTIVSSGLYLQKAGPDFFNAQIVIGTQKWAGMSKYIAGRLIGICIAMKPMPIMIM